MGPTALLLVYLAAGAFAHQFYACVNPVSIGQSSRRIGGDRGSNGSISGTLPYGENQDDVVL